MARPIRTCFKTLCYANVHFANPLKRTASTIESVQDFLIMLDMKPCMHLVEISIFSLNHVILRLTKIMNNLLEHQEIRTFKVIFLC